MARYFTICIKISLWVFLLSSEGFVKQDISERVVSLARRAMTGRQLGTGGAGWRLLPFLSRGLRAVMPTARPDSERLTQHGLVYARGHE